MRASKATPYLHLEEETIPLDGLNLKKMLLNQLPKPDPE